MIPTRSNTSTGWNWSYVVEAKDTWIFYDNTAASYVWNTQASLSFSRDDADVVWVVTDLMSDYCGELFDDGGTPEDPCDDLYEYRDLSEDIYVFRSEDGGSNTRVFWRATIIKEFTTIVAHKVCNNPNHICIISTKRQ
jgi:hypothetical protein